MAKIISLFITGLIVVAACGSWFLIGDRHGRSVPMPVDLVEHSNQYCAFVDSEPKHYSRDVVECKNGYYKNLGEAE